MIIVYSIIGITVLFTWLAWRDAELMEAYIGHPYLEDRFGEKYRFLTSGFLHADPFHLLFNIVALASFGRCLLEELKELSIVVNGWFVVCYLGGMVMANVVCFLRHRHDPLYKHLGASAGVSAVVAATVMREPWAPIGVILLPIYIPGIFYLIGYIALTFYIDHERTRINHVAHVVGYVVGILFVFVLFPDAMREFAARLLRF